MQAKLALFESAWPFRYYSAPYEREPKLIFEALSKTYGFEAKQNLHVAPLNEKHLQNTWANFSLQAGIWLLIKVVKLQRMMCLCSFYMIIRRCVSSQETSRYNKSGFKK